MRSRTSLAVLAAMALASCTTTPLTESTNAPQPSLPPVESTQAVLAFRQADQIKFTNAAGRVWGGLTVKSSVWAWSADGKHLGVLDDGRLHLVDSATGQSSSQPCPCNGLTRFGDKFATISKDGTALLLFTPGAEAERVPLQRRTSYTQVITANDEHVVIAEEIPEDKADYRGQSALLAVDTKGAMTPMIAGKSAVSIWAGVTSPDGKGLVTVEAPSSGVCYTVPSVLSLRHDQLNPVQEPMAPSDAALDEAMISEVRIITRVRWAGTDPVVTFGPKPDCMNPLGARYLTYRLTGGKWELLAKGLMELGFGAENRSYAIELPAVVKPTDRTPWGEGQLAITYRDGTRKPVGDNVQSFILTPAEEADGTATPRALPQREPVAEVTDVGDPLDAKYRELAKKIADAADAGDVKTLESLCAKCDEPTQKLIGTTEGRSMIRKMLRSYPAVDKTSATFPGLSATRCFDAPGHKQACTARHLSDVALLGLKSGPTGVSTAANFYASPTESVRLETEGKDGVYWSGRSISAEPYKLRYEVQGIADTYFFQPPYGDYYCGIYAERAGCEGKTKPIPPRPDSCSDQISWGGGMFVGPSGEVEFICAGGVTFYWGNKSRPGPEDRLAAGQRVAALGYTCTAGEREVKCVHDESGHGFRMTPDSHETF